MKMIEIILVAVIATGLAVISWFALYQYTDIYFFQSFYSILIFPLIFGVSIIMIYNRLKK
ncbi:MAG: hypothetical protein R6W73_07025 [Candidatus Saliniplasma sp.]